MHLFLQALYGCQSVTLLGAFSSMCFKWNQLRQVRTEPEAKMIIFFTLFLRGACLFKSALNELLKYGQASSASVIIPVLCQSACARLYKKSCTVQVFHKTFENDLRASWLCALTHASSITTIIKDLAEHTRCAPLWPINEDNNSYCAGVQGQ